MAVRSAVITQIMGPAALGLGEALYEDGVRVVWAGLLNGDNGAPVQLPGYADKSFQSAGTFGAAGSVQPEGSNDNISFFQLKSPTYTGIAHTSAGLDAITEACIFVQPHVTAGDGTTNLTVTMWFRKTATWGPR